MSDWFYRFGRALLGQTVRFYYRRIEVVGRERLPATGAAVLVANHPNSVADAFLLASQLTSRKINFIARDAITRAPVFGWLFRQFGLVGVARPMDYEGQRNLARQRNELAIAGTVPRLLAGEIVAIFGEGVSTDARRLGTIRKGALRFGLAAEREAGYALGLLWIPVGINYSAKHHFRSDVLIRVGQPFGLADLSAESGLDPLGHEQEIINFGTARLQRELESLVVHIEREELSGLVDWMARLLGSPTAPLAARVERQQRLARIVQYFSLAAPERLRELEQALHGYEQHLAAAGFTDEVVRQRHPTLAFWVSLRGLLESSALMLLNLYGWANSFIPRRCAYLSAPLGRQRLKVVGTGGEHDRVQVTKQALWGAIGGWIGAAIAFPLQTYLVFRLGESAWGLRPGLALATLYALSLIPSWRLWSHRRDILKQHYLHTRDAYRFLRHAAPATRLQRQRRRLQRHLRALLAAYEREAPRAA